MTLPPLSFAAVLSLITLLMGGPDASAQDRRPCLYRNVPAGCAPILGLPKPPNGVAFDPDVPGLVPLNEIPLVKALTAPDEWQPPPGSKTGTVTVEPVSPEEQNQSPLSSTKPP